MSANTDVAARWSRIQVDPVIVGIVGFFVVHMLVRIFGTSNFSVDDTETAVHTQVFQLYYSLRNPPLFDWLFFGLSQVLGVNVVTMQILKTALLSAAGIFFYLAVRPAFRHRAALDAAIVAYGATAFYGWDVFQQFSHTIALIFSMAFTLWAFLRVVRFARTPDYLLLGIGLGLGILSKYLFGLYFLALLIAALRAPAYRRAVLSWRMAIVFAAGLLVVSPLLFGLSDAILTAYSTLSNRVGGSSGSQDLASFGYLLLLTAEFWLPFAAILWLCLARWPAAAEDGKAEIAVSPARGDESFFPFLRDTTVVMVVAMFAAFLLLGTAIPGGRYLVAIFSLLPLAVFAAVDRWQAFPTQALHQFWRGSIAVIIGVAVVRFAIFLFISPPFCVPRCVLFVDYAPVAARLGTPDGKQNVILTDHVHIGSNLIRQVPDARIVMDHYTGGSDLGIADAANRNCYFVWFQKYRDADEVPLAAALERALRRPPLESELAAIGPVEPVVVDWQTKVLWDWGPETIVGIAPIDSRERICNGGRIPGLSAPPTNNAMQ
jgi:Dolichyl-phosphate-mannose-protein mannosyltransferase